MAPFQLRFTLTRRQRLTELFPWLPAIAGSLGFSLGAVFLATSVSPWFLLLIALPFIYYRGLFVLLLELAFRPGKLVEMRVEDGELTVRVGKERRVLPLEGIIQVFRAGDAWTVLHHDGSALTIPVEASNREQIDYLKSFALRAAIERREEAAE